jgi:hypothetical protein
VDVFAGDVDANSVSTGDLDTGRSWTDVTPSRSFNTTETNSTESEISVACVVNVTADNTTVGLNGVVDDGTQRLIDKIDDDHDSVHKVAIQIPVVPTNADYEIIAFNDTNGFELEEWQEFR